MNESYRRNIKKNEKVCSINNAVYKCNCYGVKDLRPNLSGLTKRGNVKDPALKEYYEKLDLAKRMKEANEQVITAWADEAVRYKQ